LPSVDPIDNRTATPQQESSANAQNTHDSVTHTAEQKEEAPLLLTGQRCCGKKLFFFTS